MVKNWQISKVVRSLDQVDPHLAIIGIPLYNVFSRILQDKKLHVSDGLFLLRK